MTEPTSQPPTCTLDDPAFRMREDEFRDLFARALRRIEPIHGRAARLFVNSAHEAELRDLLARETRCCTFFDFQVTAAAEAVTVAVRVPAGSEAALTFLLDIAHDGIRAAHHL
jgi:hypothetical protein